jgi:hypothetical protein
MLRDLGCLALGVGLLLAVAPVEAQTQSCQNQWSNMFLGDGGFDDVAAALAVFENELYFAGSLTLCMGRTTWNVAKWDGRRWTSLGTERPRVGQTINALAAYQDPNSAAPTMYAGGVYGVHRWASSGGRWEQVAEIDVDGTVNALCAWKDKLYAAGTFSRIGGIPAHRLACWDGASWAELCDATDPNACGVIYDPNDPNDPSAKVCALTVFDAGAGEKLIVGGKFTQAGSCQAACLARWDGNSWSEVGDGIRGGEVDALTGWMSGSGVIYVGGRFSSTLDPNEICIAAAQCDPNDIPDLFDCNDPDIVCSLMVIRWDGERWEAVGHGVGDHSYALGVCHDSSGPRPALYVGGHGFNAGNARDFDTDSEHIARWGCGGMIEEPIP